MMSITLRLFLQHIIDEYKSLKVFIPIFLSIFQAISSSREWVKIFDTPLKTNLDLFLAVKIEHFSFIEITLISIYKIFCISFRKLESFQFQLTVLRPKACTKAIVERSLNKYLPCRKFLSASPKLFLKHKNKNQKNFRSDKNLFMKLQF